MKQRDTDYLHAAARVSYMDNYLIKETDLLKALDAPSAEDAYRLLSAKPLLRSFPLEDYEKAFTVNLKETYDLIEHITGNRGFTHVFRFPADGHNVKVLVKERRAAGDFSALYKNGGTIPAELLKQEFSAKRFELAPPVLKEAGLLAVDVLAKTGDSQAVDVIIDKAVLRLMEEKAAALEIGILSRYVQLTADLINLKTALRLLRMGKDAFAAEKAFLEGGSLSVRTLAESYSSGYKGISALAAKLPQGEPLATAITAVRDGVPLTIFEQQADKCIAQLFLKAERTPFGPEPIFAFLYKKEREVKAVRLVLTSRLFGLPGQQAAERLRYMYAD